MKTGSEQGDSRRRPGPFGLVHVNAFVRGLWNLCFAALVFLVLVNSSVADGRSAGRISMGIKLFRATLAADFAIVDKASPDGELELLVICGDDCEKARQLSEKLLAGGPVRNLPLNITVADNTELLRYDHTPPAALFIAETTIGDDQLKALVDFAIRHQVILYSPFEGHVEQGVTAVLFITARVQPYINEQSLEKSKIRMKAFFLKVAKHYRRAD